MISIIFEDNFIHKYIVNLGLIRTGGFHFLDQEFKMGTSLVMQWLRIHLPMQGTRVRALVREDPTCHGATKPVRHNY